MEHELQKPAYGPKPSQTLPVKRRTDLLLVDIYYIRAVGFYRTLIKPDTKSFVTSLYEIDRIIEEKEVEAIQADAARDELTNKDLIA